MSSWQGQGPPEDAPNEDSNDGTGSGSNQHWDSLPPWLEPTPLPPPGGPVSAAAAPNSDQFLAAYRYMAASQQDRSHLESSYQAPQLAPLHASLQQALAAPPSLGMAAAAAITTTSGGGKRPTEGPSSPNSSRKRPATSNTCGGLSSLPIFPAASSRGHPEAASGIASNNSRNVMPVPWAASASTASLFQQVPQQPQHRHQPSQTQFWLPPTHPSTTGPTTALLSHQEQLRLLLQSHQQQQQLELAQQQRRQQHLNSMEMIQLTGEPHPPTAATANANAGSSPLPRAFASNTSTSNVPTGMAALLQSIQHQQLSNNHPHGNTSTGTHVHSQAHITAAIQAQLALRTSSGLLPLASTVVGHEHAAVASIPTDASAGPNASSSYDINANTNLAASNLAVSATTGAILQAPPPALPPPITNGPNPHYTERTIVSLAAPEDACWLSEFHCFLRANLLEMFRASTNDLVERNNSRLLRVNQIGLRCRYCAHLESSARAPRSSAFPSSIPQIYQSVTMMLREHFGSCLATPREVQEMFTKLKKENLQSASDSKKYWVHAAKKIGLTDSSERGLDMTEVSRLHAATIPTFGSNNMAETLEIMRATDPRPLIDPKDSKNNAAPEFLVALFQHVVPIKLTNIERVGVRRGIPPQLPGLGCRYCVAQGRLGLSRVFPTRRRAFAAKVIDLYQHVRRCPLCPTQERERLIRLYTHHEQVKQQQEAAATSKVSAPEAGVVSKEVSLAVRERDFLHLIWSRLGNRE